MRPLITLLVLLTALPLSVAGSLKPGQTKVLSWKPGNFPLQGSFDSAISGNGRFVALTSNESDLTGWTDNGRLQIVLLDRQTGLMELASRTAGNAPANDHCYGPDISDNGRYVVYYSRATNLAGGDPGSQLDVFRFDRKLKTTERVSITYLGLFGDGESHQPSISGDGRSVVFKSNANNMVAGSNNGVAQIYVRDLQAGTTVAVSASPGGLLGNFQSVLGSLSRNGRLVAYQSLATNLGASAGGVGYGIYVKNLQTGVNQLISRGHQGQTPDASSYRPQISGNGRFVAFASQATNLTGNDRGHLEFADLFVYDRKHDRMKEFVAKRGKRHYHNGSAGISRNGRFVLVESTRDLFDDQNQFIETESILHLVDTRTGRITLESVNSKGRRAKGYCSGSALSANGRFISLSSDAKNLGRDHDECADVFVRRVR